MSTRTSTKPQNNWCGVYNIVHSVESTPGTSSLIRKEPEWVQVFIPTEQEPQMTFLNDETEEIKTLWTLFCSKKKKKEI